MGSPQPGLLRLGLRGYSAWILRRVGHGDRGTIHDAHATAMPQPCYLAGDWASGLPARVANQLAARRFGQSISAARSKAARVGRARPASLGELPGGQPGTPHRDRNGPGLKHCDRNTALS